MPNWLRERLLYQIFPDLFYKPEKNVSVPKGFYGGTLRGIVEKLDYVQNWGFDALYINPVFRAVSSHRYNVLDFYEVDPILGTMEDFENFVSECHRRGIKVILDIPFNHVSEKHRWFQDVLNNENSRYRDYFVFDGGVYNRWRGSDLVELNLTNSEVLDELILSEKSVLKFWLSKGIDGIRLDCANDLGMKVTKLIKDTAHRINRDVVVMGEVFNFAGEWSKVLDSLQSYYLSELLFSLVRGEISIHSFSEGVRHLVEGVRYNVLLNSLNILSSHDTSRILDVIGEDIEVYRVLLGVQFTFPGVPVVLYGEEIGLFSGKCGEESARNVMIWNVDKWNKSIMSVYREFIKLRKSRVELRKGKFVDLSSLTDYSFLAYMRFGRRREEFSIVFINPTDRSVEKKVFIPYSHFHDALKVVDYFSGESFLCRVSSVSVKLSPFQVMVLLPDWKYIEGYSFYKRE
ncbi:MAG: alpha-amylase family glycosyl hydrolase [Brevinematia bacterium]